MSARVGRMSRATLLAAAGYGWLLLTVFVGGAAYPGYLHRSRFISELGAVDAPHAALVSWLGFLPAALLLIAFAVHALRRLRGYPGALVGFALFAFYAFGLAWAAPFPCDAGCRPADPSIRHVLHVGVGLLGYLAGAVAPWAVAADARAWSGSPKLAVLGIVCGSNALLALLLLDADSGWVGAVQRSLEASLAVWALACAWTLDRRAA